MTAQSLTKEQEEFLEECLLEFSDRYTDAEVEYKKTYDVGIKPPPIMYPWYGRPYSSGNRDRDRAGGSQRSEYRERRYENNYRDRDQHRDNNRERRYPDNRRFRPY